MPSSGFDRMIKRRLERIPVERLAETNPGQFLCQLILSCGKIRDSLIISSGSAQIMAMTPKAERFLQQGRRSCDSENCYSHSPSSSGHARSNPLRRESEAPPPAEARGANRAAPRFGLIPGATGRASNPTSDQPGIAASATTTRRRATSTPKLARPELG